MNSLYWIGNWSVGCVGGAVGGGVEMEGDSISTMEPSLVRAKEHCRTDVEALSRWTRSASEG